MNTSLPTTTILALFACLTLLGMPAAADYEVDVDISEFVCTAGASGIDIDFGVGELTIEQAEGNEIEVSGDVTVQGWRHSRVDELAEALELVVETGDTIRIRLPRERYGVDYRIDLTVYVPAGLDLDIHLGVGALEAKIELPDRADMRVGVGDLQLELPADTSARIDAKVNVGDVQVSDFDRESDRARRRMVVGARFDGIVGDESLAHLRDLLVRVGVGAIEIEGRG